MFLQLDKSPVPIKLVYQLSEELRKNPRLVELAQAMTLENSKPFAGLKGTYGLYGSEESWSNIRNGVIPRREVAVSLEPVR